MHFVEHYLVAAILFVVIDGIWLRFVAKQLYERELKGLLATKANLPAAVVFYLIYIVGIVYFALTPALQAHDALYAFGRGALLGLLMYATYDLTNLATLKSWPAKLSAIDITWGAFVTGIVTVLTYGVFHL